MAKYEKTVNYFRNILEDETLYKRVPIFRHTIVVFADSATGMNFAYCPTTVKQFIHGKHTDDDSKGKCEFQFVNEKFQQISCKNIERKSFIGPSALG